MTQSWTLYADAFPSGNGQFELRKGPVASVTSIKYDHADTGVETTLAGTEYTLDTQSFVARVYPAWEKSWPAVRAQNHAVRVEYVAGWARLAVPARIKQAMALLVNHLVTERQPLSHMAVSTPVRLSVDALLAVDSVMEVG